MSSSIDSEPSLENATRISKQLCESRVLNVAPIEGGRNSRIYCIETLDNVYALKFFRPDKKGRLERFEAETTALNIFEENDVEVTPKIISKDRENNCLLMEWIEGEKVVDFGVPEIEALAAFVKKVHKISMNKKYQKIRYATESCLNGNEIVLQIQKRVGLLNSAKSQHPELRDLLDTNFIPLFDEIIDWSRREYLQGGLDFSENISFEKQTLSLVDIGFHNTLRKEGILHFFDFEFFGWDDPVHLICDTLWHPGISLNSENLNFFYTNVSDVFLTNEHFLKRLKAQFPLYGLRWCMIMLNVFLKDYKSFKKDDINTKEIQLRKVSILLERIKNHQNELKDITS